MGSFLEKLVQDFNTPYWFCWIVVFGSGVLGLWSLVFVMIGGEIYLQMR